jgi:hypothetical protein
MLFPGCEVTNFSQEKNSTEKHPREECSRKKGLREKHLRKRGSRGKLQERSSQEKNSVTKSDGKEVQMKCSSRSMVLVPRPMKFQKASLNSLPRAEKVQERPGRGVY